ncbi:hypothetical protein Taro_013512 [Colocasia esculenta]|uniref:Uncharacterized protein n=1 Tax=Colocasia esculenta TaxID=4460 RepID=A0A843U6Q3_COLES|nr:hypothetical protein [Colocasia esculenta]
MAATAGPLVTVQLLRGDMATDGSNAVPLPDVLKAAIRPDIVRFVHANLSKIWRCMFDTFFKIAKWGWNVVVSNHRGLGGIPVKNLCVCFGFGSLSFFEFKMTIKMQKQVWIASSCSCFITFSEHTNAVTSVHFVDGKDSLLSASLSTLGLDSISQLSDIYYST